MFSAMIRVMFCRAVRVAQAICGVSRVLGLASSGLSCAMGSTVLNGTGWPLNREAMAVLFMEGSNIGREPERVTPAYLEAFEELLRAMHARGVVHLDVRGTGNVMIRPNGSPGLIDFQASLYTGWMPGFLRRLLEDFDMSGALKKWLQFQPEMMGEERRKELERINGLRKFWIFRGYFGLKKH